MSRLNCVCDAAYLARISTAISTIQKADNVTTNTSRGSFESSRRDFLRVGALGLAGLALPDLLRARAANVDHHGERDTTLIWLFLRGGASHFETFDPKPGNPLPYRSTVGAVQTNVPGTMISAAFPKLAKLADRFSLIRSFSHTAADHAAATHWLNTGHDYPPAANPGTPPVEPSMGSMLSRFRKPMHPRTGLPTYITLENNHQFYAEGPAWLGPTHVPFRAAGSDLKNMTPRVPLGQLDDRKSLLRAFDTLDRQLDQTGTMKGMDEFQSLAGDFLRGRARKAFDLSLEDPKVRDRYGKGRKNVGENLLLARRLAEEGVGLVTVMYGDWDSHGINLDNEYRTIEEDMKRLAPDLDHALSVFLEDLYDRGLEKKVMLAVVSEFGRSPHVNKDAGRDHWPQLGSQLIAGGGLKMGQVVGESTAKGDLPKTFPVSPNDLLATCFQFLGMPLDLQFVKPSGRPTPMLENGKPIAQLF